MTILYFVYFIHGAFLSHADDVDRATESGAKPCTSQLCNIRKTVSIYGFLCVGLCHSSMCHVTDACTHNLVDNFFQYHRHAQCVKLKL